MNWQTIESAPSDLTDVLVWRPDAPEDERIMVAHQNEYGDWSPQMEPADDAVFYLDRAKAAGITHWMRLPEPPK